MVRFLGVFLAESLPISRALLVFDGVGAARARQILSLACVPPRKRVGDLSGSQVSKLRLVLGACLIEGDLKRRKYRALKRHADIGSAAGRRHWVGLPVRGQRTRTNARTRKSRGERKNAR
jgi:small subunit ribosomal protein S13